MYIYIYIIFHYSTYYKITLDINKYIFNNNHLIWFNKNNKIETSDE